jgi:hypothetical protein
MSPEEGPSGLEPEAMRFMQLVAMFQLAAMQQMGKLPSPVTNEIERDLDQARVSIDMLEMLKQRTEGNRSEAESEMLEKIVFELQMNYVDETRRPQDTPTDETTSDDSEAASEESTDPEK